MNKYVLGFMFSKDRHCVVLIDKTHPKWQAGKLNGIGGNVQQGELPIDAMIREFEEETGGATVRNQWKHFATLTGPAPAEIDPNRTHFTVLCFAATGDLSSLHTMTEEKLDTRLVGDMPWYINKLVDNCAWLIFLALDHLDDGRPHFTAAMYK